jgi:hypothetical protein
MSNKIPEMLSADATWYKLNRENNFETFFEGLKEYLRSKLQVIKVEGLYTQYSCGVNYHHRSISGWKPFENLIDYCFMKGYDWVEVKELIEEKLERKIIYECELANDMESNKRARLQRSFGIDFGEPGCDDM